MPVNRLQDLERAVTAAQHEDDLVPELAPIYERLERLRNLTSKLEDLQNEYLADNDKRTQRKIDTIVNSINREAMEIKGAIMKFDSDTTAMLRKGHHQNIIDIRRNQFHKCGKKLLEVTKGTWDMQQDHIKQRAGQVSKRLRVRFTDDNGREQMTASEADTIALRLVQTGNEDQLFLLARDELAKAMATKEAVLDLERSMRELYQMFCDLNVLVVEQGEGLTNVERSVQLAQANIDKGQKDLRTARKNQRACIIC